MFTASVIQKKPGVNGYTLITRHGLRERMCGRFALYHTEDEIKEHFNINQLPLFQKRYNIAPSQDILCLIDKLGNKKAVLLKWGLIPFWTKEKKAIRTLINARSESVDEKSVFKRSFKTHRALVIMSGFYEWSQKKGQKQPYYFKPLDDKPLAIAALWDTWKGDDEFEVSSCCLLTTQANPSIQPIHDRMPVILNSDNQTIWLDHCHQNLDELKSLCAPCPDEVITKYPVTPKMNKASFENQTAILPLYMLKETL